MFTSVQRILNAMYGTRTSSTSSMVVGLETDQLPLGGGCCWAPARLEMTAYDNY